MSFDPTKATPAWTLRARLTYRNGQMHVSSYSKGYPEETGLLLNPTATYICELIDAQRTVSDIVDALEARYAAEPDQLVADLLELIELLASRGFVELLEDQPHL